MSERVGQDVGLPLGFGDEDNPRLQASKALFLGCLIDDRIKQIIAPLLAEFKAKKWPASFCEVFFARLAAEATLQAATQHRRDDAEGE